MSWERRAGCFPGEDGCSAHPKLLQTPAGPYFGREGAKRGNPQPVKILDFYEIVEKNAGKK